MTPSPYPNTTIFVPVKHYPFLIVFAALVNIMYSMAFINRISMIFTGKQDIDASFLFFPVLLYFTIMIFLWLLKGTEELIFHSDYLEVIRSNGMLRFRRKFSYAKISHITLVDKRYRGNEWVDTKRQAIAEQQQAVMFWNRMGRIEFTYNNRSISVLNGLHKRDEESMLNFIRDEVQKRSPGRKPDL